MSDLPVHHDAGLTVGRGRAGRFYVEGFERFDARGRPAGCDPKGIEVRTPVCPSVEDAVGTLGACDALLARAARRRGLERAVVGFNPFRTRYLPHPPLNAWESARRAACPEDATAHLHMVTYGPDLNLSRAGSAPADVVDAGRKLTWCSPFVVPWSFSSPFCAGRVWDGLSRRTFHRTGPRPAVLVFVAGTEHIVASRPSLTRLARLPGEVGRIEFKAFDACGDLELYAALLTLLKGVVLDRSLAGRRTVPDRALHRHAARHGFASPLIANGAGTVLAAADAALAGDPDRGRLGLLAAMLARRRTPAHELLRRHSEAGGDRAAIGAAIRVGEPCTVS